MNSETPTATSPRIGYLLVAVAAVLWSSSGLFAKAPFFENWPEETRGVHLAFWRAVFASGVLVFLVRRPRFRWPMIPMTLFFVAMNYTFLTAMAMTTAANTIWLQHIAPVWIFLVGVFFLKEKVHRGDWTMMWLGLSGAGTILAFELNGSALPGVIFGVLGGVTFAGVVLSIRVLRKEDAAWLITLNHLVTVACFAPIVISSGQYPNQLQLLLLAGFGIFQMGLPYLLFAIALRTIAGHQASAIVLIEPILTPLWVYLAWGGLPGYHPPQWWTYLGAGLILIGLALRFLWFAKPHDEK
ncbi:MAG: DME family drug/metabolite transporter [Pirellulaceae bacterium]|jgi:DME family drug/metabolite transporter